MSGGVDSSVAAALLKEEGYDVIGLTMLFWGPTNRCCSSEDLRDARHVAYQLEIPHYTLSVHESFRKNVVDYFVSEYVKGRTPNPCAVCNPMIKFGDLLARADALSADYLATGHYAVVTERTAESRFILQRGKEPNKDQSYFLARLSQDSLSRTLFPVGKLGKEKIRELAERYDLPVAGKSESQEVCFIPDGDVAAFVERQSGTTMKSGSIIDKQGHELGKHHGIAGYTVGQRKGLGIAVGRPIYVTAIEFETNTVIVGEEQDLYRSRFIASDPHWISIPPPPDPVRASTRIRYKHEGAQSKIVPHEDGTLEVHFDTPQKAVTPGQLAVFYDGDIVMGSAWIDHTTE